MKKEIKFHIIRKKIKIREENFRDKGDKIEKVTGYFLIISFNCVIKGFDYVIISTDYIIKAYD